MTRTKNHQMPESFRTRRILLTAFGLLMAFGHLAQAQDRPLTFQIRATPETHQQPFSGRICVFFALGGQDPNRPQARTVEPRLSQSWFSPSPMIGWDVQNWRPGESVSISWGDPRLHVFPPQLQPEQLRGMLAQAVVRWDSWTPDVGTGPGNGYGPVISVQNVNDVQLSVDRVVGASAFAETPNRKLLEVRSPSLSQFSQRDVFLRGSIQLPASYAVSPEKRYPVILEVPGFGGDHRRGVYQQPAADPRTTGVEFIRIVLDPRCPLGHHAFANSANNGPWGDALVQEFLPELDRRFRTLGTPASRFLCGHSSGGWSSLWLTVNYPEHFGGTWSTSPDPVDFRDFQRINVYADANMFRDAAGNQRPLARRSGQVAILYENFSRMEDVLGPGGQLHSFEAVFSRRGEDGKPQTLWNRQTGAIDHTVADSWKKYDIRLLLEENWPPLGPKLQGKLHVYMGSEDTFYLEGATVLLKESLDKLGSDAHVEIFPGRDHSNLFQGNLRARIEDSMASQLKK